MPGRWVYPLDPRCPQVKRFRNSDFWDDPITIASGIGGEYAEEWERKHRVRCEKCRDYGAANVDVAY